MRKTFLFILALCAASAVWGAEVTVTKTVAELATLNGWKSTGILAYGNLDDNCYLSSLYMCPPDASTNINGYYYATPDWRMYQARHADGEDVAKFTLNVVAGYVLKSATFTYTVTNTGVLQYDGNNVDSEKEIIFSGNSPIEIFTIGNTGTANNGQVRISQIKVVYEKKLDAIEETFKAPDGTDWSFNYADDPETHGVDGKYYKWTIDHCRYASNTNDQTKSHGKGVGMWKTKNSSLITTAEGGIKAASFWWNQANAKETDKLDGVTVSVDNEQQIRQTIKGAAAADRLCDVLTTIYPQSKTNSTFKIEVNGLSNAEARLALGHITIVPYLRYTYTETQEVYDDESTFDCSLQIDNTDDEGTITYISDNTDAVSFADPANPEATIVGGGEATITATWSEGASTSFKLKVNVLPTPAVTFPGITDGKKSVALNVESFTEAATVNMTVPVVYSSSNENVAMVDNNGEVTVLTTGTTEITAKVEAEKGEYKEASATYTLTVTASEASEKSFVEKFSGVSRCDGDCGYTTGAENFIGTDGLFHWTVNSVRLRKGDVIGKGGLRFSTSLEEGSYHLLPDPNYNDGIMEGGIKRIAFTYKKASGGSGANLEISAGEVLRYVKSNSETETQFAANFFVKENTSLKMFNTKGASVVTIGPISIVPYLLFTTKSDEAFLSLVNEYDVKDVLINNTDDGTVAYSILTEGAKSLINDGVVTFTNVTESETITIQAAWTPAGKSSATVTTTMTLYVDAEYKTDKTVKEKFSNYGATGWTTSEASEVTKNGDVYDWRTQLTRHNTADKLVDDQQAIWFTQGGYVATADATDNTKVGPAEGGIKRIAFDWNQNGANQTGDDLYISISVDNDEVSAIRRDGGAQPTEPWQYIHNLNVKKNATLKIENKSTKSKSDGGRVKIGTIVITPYLLYTTKDVNVKLGDLYAINLNICNNTDGGTITYESKNPEVASIANDPGHPDKLELKSVGDAIIVATWKPSEESEEVVTTSYTLHVTEKEGRNLSFQKSVKETELGGATVTNTLNGMLDATAQTWSTESDGAITSVSLEGVVSPVAIGTDIVTVNVAESENYQAGTASYKVIVRSGVADDNKLVESFSGITKDASTSETEWKGDLKDYFSWKVKSTRHNGTAGDTIGGAGVAGTVLFAKGQIATDGVIEGGIKYFTFNWKQPYVEAGATLRLTLEAGEESYQQDYIVATDNGSTTHEHLYFAGNMQVKKNVQLTLKNESFKTDGGAALTEYGRIAIDKFEIVPYLFYKTKSHTIENATEGATYTNTDLINNIDGGTITYSLIGEGADDIASIDADNGQVTVMTGGVVTVQAKWVPDATNEEEFVTTTYTLTINFPAPDVEFTAPESKNLDETIGETDMHVEVTLGGQPVESPSITYTSSNENVIKITNNGWQIIGIGKTTITATVEGTPTYGQVAKTAEIEVFNIDPTTGTAWKETFSSLKVKDNYNTNLTTIDGDQNVLKWKTRNFQHSTTDKVNSDQGIRLRNAGTDDYNNPGYVEYFTEGDVTSQEGGIKRVQFQWRIPGDQDNKKVVFDVKYKEDNQTVVRTLTYNGIAHATVYDYAQNFNLKNNNKLTIAGSTKSESPVIIGPITITPYLLYTEKTIEVNASEETSYTYPADKLINNTGSEGAITYSMTSNTGAAINANTGEVDLTSVTVAGDETITASWGDVSTTYTLKVTAKEPDFTLENKTAGAFATICLPKKIASVENATLWSINYGDKTAIEFVVANLTEDAAGMPYLVQVEQDGDVKFFYVDSEEEEVTEPVDVVTAKGFVGSLQEAEQTIPSDGTAILVSGGQLHIAGEWCVLTQNRAYIDSNNLPASAPVGGAPRRTMTLYNPDAAPTNLNGLNGAVKPMKVLRDGQFYILRDTKTYNAQGIEVQ